MDTIPGHEPGFIRSPFEEEGCEVCGGNCGQCGSSHSGGPPSMARMVQALHPNTVPKQKLPPTFYDRVKSIFTGYG